MVELRFQTRVRKLFPIDGTKLMEPNSSVVRFV